MSGMKRRTSAALLRSALALLLIWAQIAAAGHALGHLGELAGLARVEGASTQVSRDGLPLVDRHEVCLLCLAAVDLASLLPPGITTLAVAVPLSILPGAPDLLPGARRLPRPHARGPPVSS